MTKLFGLPVGSVLVILMLLLGIALGGIALLAARNPRAVSPRRA